MATTYDPTTADPGQIENVPAGDIVIDPNVRTTIYLDKSFISSIRVRGFEQYPVGYREDDKVHITVGQRRTSAALEIGWPVVPIVVKPKAQAEGDRAEELRILTQLAENEQRSPLTDHERAAGYMQLSLLGVTDTQIARKTNAPKQHIQTALAVAASETATAALQSRPITLEQAAYLVEFETDPSAVAQLTDTLSDRPEQIDHTVARLRKERADAVRVDERARELEAEGWTVHRERKSHGWTAPAGTEHPRGLRRPGEAGSLIGEDLTQLTDRHVIVYPSGWTESGTEEHYFIGVDANGLERIQNSSTDKAPLTDEEKERRRQKRADKAAMILATEVRRSWITTFLAQKKRPDMSVWIAHAVLQSSHALGTNQRDGNARDLAYQLLGAEQPSTKYGYMSREAASDFITEHPALAAALTAAYALATVEESLGDPKHYWAGMQMPAFAPYLEQLSAWGYPLSDVEQRLIDGANAKSAARSNGAG